MDTASGHGAFYAAVEQRDDPSLRGRPVVVGALPGGRGVVANCSYEARAVGIRSAMPIHDAYRRCPDAVYLRPRMAHDAAISRQIRTLLCEISPLVEPVSIDEAYLDASGVGGRFGPPAAIGAKLKSTIREATGLAASVGLAPNRLIAKLASDHGKPDGLVVVPPEEVLDFLAPKPVSVLLGVGPKAPPRLAELGIRTVADLRARSAHALQARFGPRLAAALYEQARGIASDRIVVGEPRKSISKENTFGTDRTDRTALLEPLRDLAEAVALRLPREGRAARAVTLMIRFRGFETYTRQRRLVRATDSAGPVCSA